MLKVENFFSRYKKFFSRDSTRILDHVMMISLRLDITSDVCSTTATRPLWICRTERLMRDTRLSHSARRAVGHHYHPTEIPVRRPSNCRPWVSWLAVRRSYPRCQHTEPGFELLRGYSSKLPNVVIRSHADLLWNFYQPFQLRVQHRCSHERMFGNRDVIQTESLRQINGYCSL